MEITFGTLTREQKQQFVTEGYVMMKGLFSQAETTELREYFMKLHAQGPVEGLFAPVPEKVANGDVLKQFPRFMHPHRVDDYAKRTMLDSRIMHTLTDLFEEEPLAAQSMFYFKPPGARGQALHQDNFYLKVEPGTCIAAWLAVDPADQENGGLFIVPGSNRLDILCPHLADPTKYFTKEEVDIPEGLQPVPVLMEAGDVLFFNGSVIHGSYPNTSQDRFRRSFICHYTGKSTTTLSKWYNPLYSLGGEIFDLADNPAGGPCGTEFADKGPH